MHEGLVVAIVIIIDVKVGSWKHWLCLDCIISVGDVSTAWNTVQYRNRVFLLVMGLSEFRYVSCTDNVAGLREFKFV